MVLVTANYLDLKISKKHGPGCLPLPGLFVHLRRLFHRLPVLIRYSFFYYLTLFQLINYYYIGFIDTFDDPVIKIGGCF